MSLLRTRWAAIGAAVAITLGGGGVGLVSATVESGERTVYVPITPCRIIDTRPDFQVGPRSTPLGTAETPTVSAHGTAGESSIPNDAVALSLNMTAVDATLPTFLTVWATGETRPDASSLNPSPGQPPTPNAVTTDLSNGGEFDIYNLQGDVHVLADVVGYYADHHHDDHYYRESEVDDMLAAHDHDDDYYRESEVDDLLDAHDHDGRYYTKTQIDALHATETRHLSIPPAAFQPRYSHKTGYEIGSVGQLYATGTFSTEDDFYAPVHLPDGAKITAFYAWVKDSSLFDTPSRNLNIALYGLHYDGGYTKMFDLLSGHQPTPTKLTDNTILSRGPQLVDNDTWMYVARVVVPASNWADYGDVLELHGVIVEYEVTP